MLPQALQLIPYIAVASAILLGVTVGVICYSQGSSRIGFGVSWQQSILAIFRKLRSVMTVSRPSRLGVIVHDPDLSKPHDLDDPFFDPEVRERVGAVIANAARKKVKS
jgi:hypothetical protein